MDWIRVLEVFLGAILGFSFGIFSDYVSRKIGIQNLKKKLKAELMANYQLLKENKDKYSVQIEFASPIWSMVISSGLLLYIDTKTYVKIIAVYARIKALNDSEKVIDVTNKSGQEKLIKEREELLRIIEDNKI